jgi:hypothetical protein
MIDVQRRALIEFSADSIRKVGDASLLAIEAAKTVYAGEIGKESGLFYVPRVLDLDQDKGILELERLHGLVTLLQLAIDKDTRVLEFSQRAGSALAVVHEQLVLPDKDKLQLPAEWMDGSDRNVFIHGDFASINVCLHDPSGRLVILDWSAAPIVGRAPTFGSRYFDILWFIGCVFRGATGMRFLSWDAEGIADVFLKGYAGISSINSNGLKEYLPKICRLQRQMVWYLARQKKPLKAIAYICLQIIMYARLRRFLRNYEL